MGKFLPHIAALTVMMAFTTMGIGDLILARKWPSSAASPESRAA